MAGLTHPTPTVDAPSKPLQRYQQTRNAASVFFGVLTVALCVLWARSYWWIDDFTLYIAKSLPNVSIGTILGKMGIAIAPFQISTGYASTPIDDDIREYFPKYTTLGFGYLTDTRGLRAIYLPIWLPVAMTASMALWLVRSPFRLQQFSLRTMLIVTTLVTVALGIEVWLAS